MTKQELRQFITDFYKAWKERDEAKIKSFYSDNVCAYSDFSPITLQDIYNRLEFSSRKFAEVNYYIEDLFIDDEQGKISVRMKQRHVPRDGSEDVKWQAIMLYTILDHKITEIWMSFYPNADYLNNT